MWYVDEQWTCTLIVEVVYGLLPVASEVFSVPEAAFKGFPYIIRLFLFIVV